MLFLWLYFVNHSQGFLLLFFDIQSTSSWSTGLLSYGNQKCQWHQTHQEHESHRHEDGTDKHPAHSNQKQRASPRLLHEEHLGEF